jgi:nitroimidazol reductase NimA-like FMN-containing flavoprotein (pyridoxamine 5'-phosphate oxidase superfamily)
VYLAYHEPSLYGFTTTGQKVEWMRANPLVCVEFDEVVSDTQWVSVIVFGRYEELPAVPVRNVGHFPERHDDEGNAIELQAPVVENESLFAHQLLEARAMWWEPASTARAVSAHGDLAKPLAPIYYKVWIDQVTGYESTRDADDPSFSAVRVGRSERLGWLRRVLTRLRE